MSAKAKVLLLLFGIITVIIVLSVICRAIYVRYTMWLVMRNLKRFERKEKRNGRSNKRDG